MPGTHTLEVVAGAGAGDMSRKVQGTERVVLANGHGLESWKLDELNALELDEHVGTLLIIKDGFGEDRRIPSTGRIEVGADAWPLASVSSFVLREIPKPKEAEPPPVIGTRVWIAYADGRSETVVLGSGADLSGERLDAPVSFQDDEVFEPGGVWGRRLVEMTAVKLEPIREGEAFHDDEEVET
jgi:hypothetical protein